MRLYRPKIKPSTPPHRIHHVTESFRTACQTFWHLGQIGHRSEYSIERLLAFRDYYERTSIFRALAVCFVTPLPAILASFLVDCIPLRDPSEGWKANYAFWIRDVVDAFMISLGGVMQTQAVIMADALSNTGVVMASLGTAVTYALLTLGIAAIWRFPVPFGMIFLVGPFVTIIVVFTLSIIGPSAIANSPILFSQLKAHAWIVFTQGAVAMAYPLFTVVFYRLSGIEQTTFVFVLPIIKFTAKTIIAKAATGAHEYVGMIVVFSVDVFNVYYVGICMQISKSTMTTVAMVSLDFFHVIIGVRAILRQINIARKRNKSVGEPSIDCFEDLSTMMSKLLKERNEVKGASSRIRVFAPFPLPLSDNRARMLTEVAECLDARSENGETHQTLTEKSFGSSFKLAKRNQVLPAKAATLRIGLPSEKMIPPRKGSSPRRLLTLMDSNPATSAAKLRKELSHKTTETAVWDILQALFHAEYLLIAEYIEFALPMLYAMYLLGISQLPVAKYYPQTAVPFTKLVEIVANILILTVVELVGFIGLLVVLRRKFGISPLYQLAFVLETHVRTVQGHLLVWTVFILRMALKHQGVASDIHLG